MQLIQSYPVSAASTSLSPGILTLSLDNLGFQFSNEDETLVVELTFPPRVGDAVNARNYG